MENWFIQNFTTDKQKYVHVISVNQATVLEYLIKMLFWKKNGILILI